ncbi:nuclear transport factor 2 family protein [Paraburkholderia phenoliruptrix]|nr:nuclear transport factor 2 family protein [Paraburkholderia phenoliruptrix]
MRRGDECLERCQRRQRPRKVGQWICMRCIPGLRIFRLFAHRCIAIVRVSDAHPLKCAELSTNDWRMEMASSSEALYTRQVRNYLEELERGDVAAICALFTPNAQIFSPFLGWMRPAPFFAKVEAASGESRITPIDICVSTTGARRATGYFVYDWGLKDGSAVRFECVDVFEFDDNGLIERMIIVYDTHPIRSTVGDKYA